MVSRAIGLSVFQAKSDDEIARSNILAQELLMSQFRAAILWVGSSVVAERLGIEVSELERRLDEVDFSITELRLLATSCEMELSYNVYLGTDFRRNSLSELKKNEKFDE